jgi:hypothetical protein
MLFEEMSKDSKDGTFDINDSEIDPKIRLFEKAKRRRRVALKFGANWDVNNGPVNRLAEPIRRVIFGIENSGWMVPEILFPEISK